jgi:fermentation-respiration switch protein FrsA (DUF1100 family)
MELPADRSGDSQATHMAATHAAPQRLAKPPMSLGKRLWRAVRTISIAYLVIVLATMLLENRLVYHPSVYPAGDWKPYGLKVEDAEFQAADGTKLHGWFLAREKPRAVVLLCHGNAGNLTGRADLLGAFVDAGASAMVFDYRGFGKSEGSPSEAGILQGARAARAWLANHCSVAEKDIVLFGESLGGGVAVDLAANDGARGLILQSTFTSLPDVAARFYPWLPVRLLMRNRLDSLSKIGQYEGPLLQIHGDADTLVPLALGTQLFAAAPDANKVFVTLRGGGHNNAVTHEFTKAVNAFFSRLDQK